MSQKIQFESHQPCEPCTNPEEFRLYMAGLDMTRDYMPHVDAFVDVTALYFAQPNQGSGAEPAANGGINSQKLLDATTQTALAASKLDEIRTRLDRRLTKVDCAVYCGGLIRRCPKLGFAALASGQLASIMRDVAVTTSKVLES